MAAKVTASEMMKSHITSFLEGMAKGDASRIPGACAPNGKFASLTVPPAGFINRLLKKSFRGLQCPSAANAALNLLLLRLGWSPALSKRSYRGSFQQTVKLSPFKATVL